MDEFYLLVLFSILAVVLLIGPLVVARFKLKEEQGKTPSFQTLSSCRIGLYRSNIPSTRVSVYEEFLVISVFWPKIIKYEEIENLEFSKNIFGHTLKIERGGHFSIALHSNKSENLMKHILPYLRTTVSSKIKARYKLA